MLSAKSGDFVKVLDVLLEQEQIGFVRARETDEPRIVKLDDAFHFLAVAQADAYRHFFFHQALQVTHLLVRMIRGFDLADFTGHV